MTLDAAEFTEAGLMEANARRVTAEFGIIRAKMTDFTVKNTLRASGDCCHRRRRDLRPDRPQLSFPAPLQRLKGPDNLMLCQSSGKWVRRLKSHFADGQSRNRRCEPFDIWSTP